MRHALMVLALFAFCDARAQWIEMYMAIVNGLSCGLSTVHPDVEAFDGRIEVL